MTYSHHIPLFEQVADPDWQKLNRSSLVAEINHIRQRLEVMIGREDAHALKREPALVDTPSPVTHSNTAIDHLSAGFDLTPFDRAIILLCAAAALDGAVAQLCAAAQQQPACTYPTLGLALELFHDVATPESMLPTAPLRRWNLIRASAAEVITAQPLRIDDWVLGYLLGKFDIEPALTECLAQLESHTDRADAGLTTALCKPNSEPIIILNTSRVEAQELVAAHAARAGLRAFRFCPGSTELDLPAIARLWNRHLRLEPAVLLICEPDKHLPAIKGPLIVQGDDSAQYIQGETRALRRNGTGWHWLGTRALRAHTTLGSLARISTPEHGLEALVLSEQQLRLIALFISATRPSGLQTTGSSSAALFAGPSGTGKTYAAGAIAHELGSELWQIDLSAVSSKYIGESEKNISRVFDAARDANALLLFDEGDALFGKRGDIKDGRDRYANQEVSHLLQCMDAHRGPLIITTNLRGGLDVAFDRRLFLAVDFVVPDRATRARLWALALARAGAPPGICVERLSELYLTGSGITNVVHCAGLISRTDRTALGVAQLVEAVRIEYAKSNRPLAQIELALADVKAANHE